MGVTPTHREDCRLMDPPPRPGAQGGRGPHGAVPEHQGGRRGGGWRSQHAAGVVPRHDQELRGARGGDGGQAGGPAGRDGGRAGVGGGGPTGP